MALEDLSSLRGGHLRVGASQTTGTYLLPRMLGLFRHKHPDVVVQLHVHSTRRTSCYHCILGTRNHQVADSIRTAIEREAQMPESMR